MKKIALIAAAMLVALVAAVTAVSQDQTEQADEGLQQSGGEALFHKYRSGDLNRQEFDEFVRMMAARPLPSYLECSAARYLESEGYQEVTLHGLRKMKLDSYGDPKPYQIASCWPKMCALELNFSDPLPPGVYWAKVHSLSIEILDKDGKVHRYGVKELE